MNRDEYKAAMVKQAIETLLWSELDDDGEPLDGSCDASDLDASAESELTEDCGGFVDECWDDLEDMDPGQAGHDFILTRNGHGVGFWDRGLGERGDRLTKSAKVYGTFGLYLGDDGWLYSHN